MTSSGNGDIDAATLLRSKEALQAFLEGAGAPELPQVRDLLGRNPELDPELLNWLGAVATPEAAEATQAYIAAGTSGRRQVKAAKRALHRMRSKGVNVHDAAPAEAGQGGGFSMNIEAMTLDDPRAYVTSIDGSGSRLVWIVWRSPSGGSRVLQAVLDDTIGIREAEVAAVRRSGFREYIEQMQSNPAVLLDQVEMPRVLELLAAAARLNREVGAEIPEAYEDWLQLLGDGAGAASGSEADTTRRPRIYNALDADQVRSETGLIDEAMKLLREPHFQSWAMEGEAIDAAAEAVLQAETSTLLVSDEQRRERVQDAIKDAVQVSFDDATRQRYRARLEAMADVLWSRGDEKAARQALAAAIGLTEVGDLFHGHAMARALVHRGVWLAYQDRRRDETSAEQASNLIRP